MTQRPIDIEQSKKEIMELSDLVQTVTDGLTRLVDLVHEKPLVDDWDGGK